ncbi:MAG: hypothetical protein FJX76_24350 [Armatimonadetes bacterium]|nr:hypothetical protein [Armatimonadota bacterium]
MSSLAISFPISTLFTRMFASMRQASLATAATNRDRRDTCRLTDQVRIDVVGVEQNATAVDLSDCGMRILSTDDLSDRHMIFCRVEMPRRTVDMRMQIVWTRRTETGFEHGLRYCPIHVGEQYMANLWLFRTARKARPTRSCA